MLIAPKIPLALLTSVRVIDEKTSSLQAHCWQEELEILYTRFFNEPSPTWTWNDIHDCDRDILVELEEVIRAGIKPPLDMELVSSFRTPAWRKPYWKQLFSFNPSIANLSEATLADIPSEEKALWLQTKVLRAPDGKLTESEQLTILRDWKAAQTFYGKVVDEKINGMELVRVNGQRYEWNQTFQGYWALDGAARQLTREAVSKFPVENGEISESAKPTTKELPMNQSAPDLVDLSQWYVCPVLRKNEHTKEALVDRTQAFLVRSNMAEIVLAIAKSAQPNYEFSGEVIPYEEYVPGLSKAGQVEDFRRWVGFQNSPTSLPLGTVVVMD